jgi:uncharacterized protein YjiS (DUF1127 family)
LALSKKVIQQEDTMLTHSAAANSYDISEEAGPQGSFVRRFLKTVAAWHLRRRQRAELYALSDRMLKDIGVSRYEIGIINLPNRNACGRVR